MLDVDLFDKVLYIMPTDVYHWQPFLRGEGSRGPLLNEDNSCRSHHSSSSSYSFQALRQATLRIQLRWGRQGPALRPLHASHSTPAKARRRKRCVFWLFISDHERYLGRDSSMGDCYTRFAGFTLATRGAGRDLASTDRER